jgi:hypothetical protein
MNMRFLAISLVFDLMAAVFLSTGFCADISIEDLVNEPGLYDGKALSVTGELIGDIMPRQEHAWVNVRDSSGYLIGAWLLKSELKDIGRTGSFDQKGDTVTVRGIFHRKCPIHYGELDLHVKTLDIVSRGHALDYPISIYKIKAIVALGAVALCLSILIGLRKKREA